MEYNDKILEYLNPLDNVNLSLLNNSDRYNIIILLKQYYLELRDEIYFPDDASVGLEIEFENADREIIQRELDILFVRPLWKVVDDRSLYNGAEINSPIISNNENNFSWMDLSNVCDIVSRNASILDNSSGHIHIGMQILGKNSRYWANFIKLWMTYENVIFRFLYGEYLSPRNKILDNAKPISRYLIDIEPKIEDKAKMINPFNIIKLLDVGESYLERRMKAINFINVSKVAPYMYEKQENMHTLEFRCPNGTLDPVIWQNNVNLLIRLMMYAKSDMFNEDIINRRKNIIVSEDIPSNIRMYSRIYMEQAIELCDLIFDNNMDKIYFLRQYIKDGIVSNKALTKSKPFTRKRVM